jgi:AAA family ATP:ADP antiporter
VGVTGGETSSLSGPGLNPATASAVRSAILAIGMLVAQQVAGKATRDALFLSQFDVTALPLAAAASAILSLIAVLAFARGMARLTPARMVPLALVASSVLLLGEWTLSLAMPRAAAVAVYLHMSVFGGTLLSGFWSLLNERLDPHAAKRVMGQIGAGASMGGLLGGLITWCAATVIAVPTMLVVLAALTVLCLVPLAQLRPLTKGTRAPGPEEGAPSPSGLRLIREEPYLRNLAFLVGLSALVETLLDYVFNAGAVGSFGKGPPLMSFFALYHGAIGLLGVATQATLVRPSLERLGLATTLALPPGLITIGSALVMVYPHPAARIVLRGAQAVLRNSLFRSSYELLYTPLAQDQKRPTKAIVDVGCDRVGTTLGSALVMFVLFVAPAHPVRPLLALAAAAGATLVLLARLFHRGYIAALVESLRAGVIRVEAGEVVDATTRDTLAAVDREKAAVDRDNLLQARKAVQSQGSVGPTGIPNTVRAVAELVSRDPDLIRGVLCGRALDGTLVSFVIPLLANDELFGDVLRALRSAAPGCTGQLVDALLDPEQDVIVRRRVPRVLTAVPTQRAADGLLAGLHDERFDIRLRCGQALVKVKRHEPTLEIEADEIFSVAIRELAAEVISRRTLDHVFDVLSLVLEREPLKIALWALRSGDEGLSGTALEYLYNVLPRNVRESLWPRLDAPPPPATGRLTEELRDDLLRSMASNELGRTALRRSRGTKK